MGDETFQWQLRSLIREYGDYNAVPAKRLKTLFVNYHGGCNFADTGEIMADDEATLLMLSAWVLNDERMLMEAFNRGVLQSVDMLKLWREAQEEAGGYATV